MTGARRALRVVEVLALLGVLASGFLVLSGRLRVEPVVTGSMAPRYPTGTLVAVTRVAPRDLRVGDVVMLVPPPPYRTPTGGPVMHRVISLTTAPDGRVLLRTKGDANRAADPWTVDAGRGGVMRLRASSVAAGRAVEVLRHTAGGPGLLVGPGLVVLWLWRQRPAYRPRHAATA